MSPAFFITGRGNFGQPAGVFTLDKPCAYDTAERRSLKYFLLRAPTDGLRLLPALTCAATFGVTNTWTFPVRGLMRTLAGRRVADFWLYAHFLPDFFHDLVGSWSFGIGRATTFNFLPRYVGERLSSAAILRI